MEIVGEKRSIYDVGPLIIGLVSNNILQKDYMGSCCEDKGGGSALGHVSYSGIFN